MTVTHDVPADADLAAWFRMVGHGDTVILAPGAWYTVPEGISVERQTGVRVRANGATIALPAGGGKPGTRPLELIACVNWQVWDLTVHGGRPSSTTEFDAVRAPQHGFTIRGSMDMLVKRCTSRDVWGDGVYIGDFDGTCRDVVVCDHTVDGTGRHGVTTISARDVVVNRPHLVTVARTGFNFEVHPGQQVLRFAAEDVRVDHVGLKLITATGEGEASGVSFDGLSLPATHLFDPLVYGTGAGKTVGTTRTYGPKRDWTIRRVRGGAAPRPGKPIPARFVNVEGLTLEDIPERLPVETTGSTPTQEQTK